MRIISEFETQFKLGQSSLSKIKLDYTSRDDITRLLLGLQSIPLNKEAQAKIFQILEKRITVKSQVLTKIIAIFSFSSFDGNCFF